MSAEDRAAVERIVAESTQDQLVDLLLTLRSTLHDQARQMAEQHGLLKRLAARVEGDE